MQTSFISFGYVYVRKIINLLAFYTGPLLHVMGVNASL